MLAALDAPEGYVFEEVRKVALRLERTRKPVQLERRRPWNSMQGLRTKREQYRAGSTATLIVSAASRTNPHPRDPVRKRTQHVLKEGFHPVGHNNRPSLSTHLKSWCHGVRKSAPTRTEAYGEPCYCDIEVFGLNTKALIDTGSVISIIPVGLLQLAHNLGADIDQTGTILGDADKDEVLDASGNPMTFLKRIAVDIKVKGAKKANVQLHVQQASDTLILLGTNAMEALGIGVSLTPETDTDTEDVLELQREDCNSEQVFWSNSNKIASGVCRISHGHGIIPVVNKGEEPWVIPKGKVLGEWSNDLWYDPNTAEIPGDVLEKATEVPEKGKASEVIQVLESNKRTGIANPKEDEPPTHDENEKVVCSVRPTCWLDELRQDKDWNPIIEAVEKGIDMEVRLPRHDRKLSSKDFRMAQDHLKLILEDGSSALVVPESRSRQIFDANRSGTLKLARECSLRNTAFNGNSYDKQWKRGKSQTFQTGDRVYMKIPAEKGKASHPKLTYDWTGPYRVLEASRNSALITLIGDNEEPLRIPFDHLVKVPPEIDDTPVKGLTKRGRRGRPKKRVPVATESAPRLTAGHDSLTVRKCNPIAGPTRTILPQSISSVLRLTCTTTSYLPCLFRRPWSTILPNAPVPEWAPTTPYELGRALTIAMQTHTPDAVKRDLLLDDSYHTLSPSALAIAYAYFRGACMHISRTVHSRRSKEQRHTHPELVTNRLMSIVSRGPLKDGQGYDAKTPLSSSRLASAIMYWIYDGLATRLRIQKPARHHQSTTVSVRNVRHCLILPNDRTIPLLDIMQCVAMGADLFLIAGPQDDYELEAGEDFLRDVADELIRQRPALKRRIINLLPTKADEGNRAPHRILGVRRTIPSYTPAQAKRFLNETVICYGIHLRLHPYRRTVRSRSTR
ncbi:hypothetical protein COOONC_05627 [Cooperia oncophora]